MPPRRAPAASSGYIQGGRAAPPHMDDDANFVTRFIREEITAPEKLAGNISVATAFALFFGGIAAVRTWGELMVPA
jgi:hypothetical protein